MGSCTYYRETLNHWKVHCSVMYIYLHILNSYNMYFFAKCLSAITYLSLFIQLCNNDKAGIHKWLIALCSYVVCSCWIKDRERAFSKESNGWDSPTVQRPIGNISSKMIWVVIVQRFLKQQREGKKGGATGSWTKGLWLKLQALYLWATKPPREKRGCCVRMLYVQ